MITQLLDNLWICAKKDVPNCVERNNIDVVYNLCQELTNQVTHVKCHHIPMRDDECDVWMRELYRRAVEMVVADIEDGKNVLVHCHEGRNRSVAVCCGVVQAINDIGWDEVEEFLRDRYDTAQKSFWPWIRCVRTPNGDTHIVRQIRDNIAKDYQRC